MQHFSLDQIIYTESAGMSNYYCENRKITVYY